MKQFEVTGRRKPSETEPEPTIFRMKIFAPNTVMAKSRFWYYLSLLKKIKRANGEILETHEVSGEVLLRVCCGSGEAGGSRCACVRVCFV